MESPEIIAYANYLESLPVELACAVLEGLESRALGSVSTASTRLRGYVDFCIRTLKGNVRVVDLLKLPGAREVEGWVLMTAGKGKMAPVTESLLERVSRSVRGSLKIRGAISRYIGYLIYTRNVLYPDSWVEYRRVERVGGKEGSKSIKREVAVISNSPSISPLTGIPSYPLTITYASDVVTEEKELEEALKFLAPMITSIASVARVRTIDPALRFLPSFFRGPFPSLVELIIDYRLPQIHIPYEDFGRLQRIGARDLITGTTQWSPQAGSKIFTVFRKGGTPWAQWPNVTELDVLLDPLHFRLLLRIFPSVRTFHVSITPYQQDGQSTLQPIEFLPTIPNDRGIQELQEQYPEHTFRLYK